MDRRTFLTSVGRLVVVLPAGYAFVGCSDETTTVTTVGNTDAGTNDAGGARDAGPGAQTLRFTSSRVNAHTHNFDLALADIDNPPGGGISGDTSVSLAHVHTVSLNEQDLRQIADGQTVTVETSEDLGHTHTFAFRR